MRLDALPKKFDQVLEGLKVREQKQILPPRFVVEEVLKEMTEFIGKPASENILATSFKTRAAKIEKLSETDRADFQARVESAITSKVYPAYQKLIDYFREILPKTTTDDGVWKLPDGDAFYAYKLRENTTTTLKPDEVHELGLRKWRGSKVRCGQSSMQTAMQVSRSAKRWRSSRKIRVFFIRTTTRDVPTLWRSIQR